VASRRSTTLFAAGLALALGLTSLLAGGAVWGGFSSKNASSAANTITAAADFRAPTSTATAIAKTAGGVPGFIRKSGTYYVYANVADTGNPASGVSTVTANVTTITSGQTVAALSAGAFSVNGVSYNRRTAALTADSTLAAGTATFSLTMIDVAGNSRTESALTVTVDNTPPTASDIQTANGSTTVGLAQIGDKITYTYSEPVEPESILAGWTGASTSVVVRLTNAANDTATTFNASNGTQLPMGSINLGRSDYVTANITFGATGTASTMVLSGNQVIVTLGTQSAAATTAAGTGTMVWTPSATATDRAGNATSTPAATESGAADKEF
jgi:hypothetical protein